MNVRVFGSRHPFGRRPLFAGSCHPRCDAGQMAVELAVLMPVVLVLALIAANLMAYMGDCARFDRLAGEAVRVLGVSPGYGEYGASSCENAIALQLEEAFDASSHISIDVTSEEISLIDLEGSSDGGADVSADPLLQGI